jgi:malonyl-CoA/methylmalonyl-CoA synthetase
VTLFELFRGTFDTRGTHPAISFADRTLTFGDLDAVSSAMAHALAARGVRPGDRLCFYLRNSLDFVVLYLGALKAGAIVVPMNILYRDRELRHIISDASPVAVIADARDLGLLPDLAPVWELAALTGDIERPRATLALPRLEEDLPALIIYTSGTTGAPKGAVLTQSMLAANARTLVTAWRITATDRLHLMLPLFHVHGLCVGLHSWLASGCRLRLEERFDHQVASGQMLAFAPTLFFAVPTMYVRMVDWPEAVAREIGSRMRLFVSGSAPLSSQVWEGFRARYGHGILERYGMSETLMIASNPYDGERRPGTVGMPLPGVELRIEADEAGASGRAGEVWVRGPSVLREYWRNAEATAAAFRDGWFRTKDVGEVSADGYLTLLGRASDLIISGGFNIYPREIEDFLVEQRGVSEAAVVGVPDAVRGEIPVAYVVIEDGWDAGAIERICRERLASFKVPRSFVVVDTLPRTALGKVQKHELVARATSRLPTR